MKLLSIVIPTRNRPEHLRYAVASVADQACVDLELVISDNSDEAVARRNQANLETLVPEHVRYLRPPEPQAMVDHWNWAVGQAAGTYATILTDRMVFKKGALTALCDVLRTHRPRLLAYPHETLFGNAPPFTYFPQPYTGDVLTVPGKEVLAAASRAHISPFWPRFLNSVCAAEMLQELQETYGAIFTGIAPDLSFCYRSIDMLREYSMWDYPLLISGGMDVSNGKNFIANPNSSVRKDFVALNQGSLPENARRILEHALIPWTSPVPCNVEMLEYLLAKECQVSGMFTDIDKQRFYCAAYRRLEAIGLQGGNIRQGLEALENFREQHGLSKVARGNYKLRRVAKIVKRTLKRNLAYKDKHENTPSFENIAQAREYAEQRPIAPLPSGSREHIRRKLFGRP